MSQTNHQVDTNVSTVEIDLDMFLGTPGAEASMAGDNTGDDKKSNSFFQKSVDLDFLDDTEEKKKDDSNNEPINVKDVLEDIDKALEVDNVDDTDPEKKTTGRPKTEKSALVNLLKKKIESGEMFAFSDYDESQPLDEYLSKLSEKDADDLLSANISHIKEQVAANTPQEFMDSLPEKLQFAAQYVLKGGQDLEGLFKALAQSEQVARLDPTADAESIAEMYLTQTEFGTDEDIAEVIEEWKNSGTLEKRTASFKKKLEEMETKNIEARIAEQAEKKRKQEIAANNYVKSVYDALVPGELNGLRLNKQTQEALYTGLIKPQYTSVNGNPTNLLGHLLEKYQFVEPNYSLVAEALWLLSDPETYRGELRKEGINKNTEDTVRKLKTEQQAGKGASGTSTPESNSNTNKNTINKKLERPTGFFRRP